MPAQYPDAIYEPREKQNRPGVIYEPERKTVGFVEDVTKLDDEVVAIENELGENPKAGYANVAERLDDIGGGGGGDFIVAEPDEGVSSVVFDESVGLPQDKDHFKIEINLLEREENSDYLKMFVNEILSDSEYCSNMGGDYHDYEPALAFCYRSHRFSRLLLDIFKDENGNFSVINNYQTQDLEGHRNYAVIGGMALLNQNIEAINKLTFYLLSGFKAGTKIKVSWN